MNPYKRFFDKKSVSFKSVMSGENYTNKYKVTVLKTAMNLFLNEKQAELWKTISYKFSSFFSTSTISIFATKTQMKLSKIIFEQYFQISLSCITSIT